MNKVPDGSNVIVQLRRNEGKVLHTRREILGAQGAVESLDVVGLTTFLPHDSMPLAR